MERDKKSILEKKWNSMDKDSQIGALELFVPIIVAVTLLLIFKLLGANLN